MIIYFPWAQIKFYDFIWLRFLNKRNLLISTNIEVFTGFNLMHPFILTFNSITRKTLWLLNMLIITCKSWICCIYLSIFIICHFLFILLCINYIFPILPHTHRIDLIVLKLLTHLIHLWSRMIAVLNMLVEPIICWSIAACSVTTGICACTCYGSTFVIGAVCFVWIASLAQSILLRLLLYNIPIYFVTSSWNALLLIFLWFLLILCLVYVLHFLYIFQL